MQFVAAFFSAPQRFKFWNRPAGSLRKQTIRFIDVARVRRRGRSRLGSGLSQPRMRRRRPFRFPWRTRRSIAGDVDDEVRFHLDMRTAELMRNGMSEPNARDEAIREFGNIDFTKRYCRAQDQAGERAMRWSEWTDELRQHIGDAIRTLRRNPGYATVAILTMLIGIGANAAIFTVTDAVMLKPLPFAEPGRLVLVHERRRSRPGMRSQMSAADVVDYGAAQTSMSAMGSIALGGYKKCIFRARYT